MKMENSLLQSQLCLGGLPEELSGLEEELAADCGVDLADLDSALDAVAPADFDSGDLGEVAEGRDCVLEKLGWADAEGEVDHDALREDLATTVLGEEGAAAADEEYV